VAARLDPILTSVVQRKLESVSREMARVIERTARSPLLHDADFGATLLDARRRLLSQEEGLPTMFYSYSFMLDHLASFFGEEIAPATSSSRAIPTTGTTRPRTRRSWSRSSSADGSASGPPRKAISSTGAEQG
jgi:N-methylhydantoinase B/oxoprolinase/acetone carboxylase alpha subunit